MKSETQTVTSNAAPMTNTFLSQDTKYGGLIKRDLSKRVRNSLFSLIGYVDHSSPPFLALHTVITYFRFFQLLGPSLFAASERFWPMGELYQKIVSYVSVVFHIVPVEYRYEATIYIEAIYFVITLFYFILMLTSSYIYKTSSKLPRAIVILISILNGSVMYLIHPVAIQMASQETSRLIMGMDTYCPFVVDVIFVVLTYLSTIVFIYAFAHAFSVTLLFRPTSFLSTSNVPQIALLLITCVITFLSGIATYLPKLPYLIFVFLTMACLVLSIFIVFMPASFVRTMDMRLVFSSGMAGTVASLTIFISGILDKKASMVILFVTIAVFVLAIIISYPVIDFYEKRSLRILDKLIDDPTITEHFSKPNQLIRTACIGFKFAHPVCLDWSIFKAGSEVWPESANIWTTFGKFVAIYPEENNLLSYIIRNIESKKLKGNFAKQTIAQGRTVLTSRETTLSPELKRKMQHVGKSVHHSKRKLRHIWDNVIQGNTHEMEHAVNNAYKTINKTQAEFNHVLSQYPNNRFIARSYARFLQEIKADQKGFQEWVEKVKILQRGLAATVDNTNTLGIEAFPNLPRVLAVKNDGRVIQNAGETESAFALDVEIDEEQVNEHMSGIRDQINALTIPGFKLVMIATVLTFLILLVAPVIAVSIYAHYYTESLNDPLEFMYYLSYLRTLANQLPSFSFHSIFEVYPEEHPVFRKPNYSDIEISSLGYYKDTKDQYAYLIKVITTSLEAVGRFRAFGHGNDILEPAIRQTFKSVLNYQFFNNSGIPSNIKVSTQTALMDYSIQLSKLSSYNTYDETILRSSVVMNPLVNTEMLNDAISSSVQSLTDYLKKLKKDIDNLMLYILIGCIIFFFIYYLVVTIIELHYIHINKNEIFSCLTSLPKNVVSGLAEALRILKKDTEGTRTTEVDTELSKQEDNILKIFATAGDEYSTIPVVRITFVICNILLFLMDVLLAYLITDMFKNVVKKLGDNTPHLNNIFGSVAYMMEAMNHLNIAAAIDSENFNYTSNTSELLNSISRSITYMTYYYQMAKYGGGTTDNPPFPLFSDANDDAIAKFHCEDESKIPESYKDSYTCFSPDQQTTLFIGLINKLSLPVVLGNATTLNASDLLFDDLWYVSAVYLYESFFHPMFASLLPRLKDIISSTIPNALPKAIAMVIIGLILVVIIFIVLSADIKKLKFALSLLLHCQLSVIMQTQKILDVLSGHFTHKGKDSTTRNSRFFVEVVSHLPDSIIMANNNMEIISANKSTERIYSVSESELIGTKITDFLSSSNFASNMSSVIETASSIAAAVKPSIAQYTNSSGNTNHLELSCLIVSQNYVLTTQDVTRIFVYNTLIEEERAKSDALLASILPPSLVPRVQKGEKNISFAVQSATILFLDIVEFTPWCGSNTAAMVMSTLNTLFKLLDNKLATHSTATKIKCIGDCYMCAGGIFVEVNQPNVHAKEIVEFGQESIECVRQLDEQLNLSLRIRVGINTGGPIVAGVLGTEKPTFEILGPAINMAQQMEHHGVPMQVHISRSVYELVYGGSFVIKERGQIEIKSGKVITYLVQDPNNKEEK